MAETVNEGDTVYDAKGNEFRIGSDGNPVPAAQYQEAAPISVTQDVKAGAVPWLAHGVEDLVGTPAAMTDLAARGMQHIPSKLGGDYLEKKGQQLQQSNFVQNWSPQALGQKYGDPAVKGMGFDPNYEPQTNVGRYARTGLEWAPGIAASALFGPEAMAATLARGAGGAAVSETLGDAVERYTGPHSTAGAIARGIGGVAGGHFAPRAVTPYPALASAGGQARVAAADQLGKELKDFGGTVDAAQRTGRGELRSLLGNAPDNNQAVTSMLLDRAGVKNYQPGQPLGPIANTALTDAGKAISAEKASSHVIRGLEYGNTVADIRQRAVTTYGKGSPELQEVEDAIKKAGALPTGWKIGDPKNKIPGAQYSKTRDELLASKNPHVAEVGSALEDAAFNTPGTKWKSNAERYADALRIKGAADAAGPFETTINPNAVLNAKGAKGAPIRTNTPMSESAQRAANVLSPVEPKKSGLGEAIVPGMGAVAGHFLGDHSYLGGPIGGMIMGGYLSPKMKSMQEALMRFGPVQKALGNQVLLPGRDYNVPVSGWRAQLEKQAQRALPVAGPSAAAFQPPGQSE